MSWAVDVVGAEQIPPDAALLLYKTANGFRAQAAPKVFTVEASAVAFSEIPQMLEWLEARMQKWEELRGIRTARGN